MNAHNFLHRQTRRLQSRYPASDTPATTDLPELLAQQMVGVSNQFRYRVGFGRVVIAADLAMSIHEDHSCAVHRKSLLIASV